MWIGLWALTTLNLHAVGLGALDLNGPRNLSGYTFEAYISEFYKKYRSEEELNSRQQIFAANLARIHVHNAEFKRGLHTWWMGVNQLADLSVDEFRSLSSARDVRFSSAIMSDLKLGPYSGNPQRVDWREQNVVTPVNGQGSCGSCWAFAATETLESHYAIASGKLLQLSAQALVSCVTNSEDCGGHGGCRGATVELAFNFTSTAGLPLRTQMPYIRRTGHCKTFQPMVASSNYIQIPSNNAMALETSVATKGPIAVYVAATTWQLYDGGIFKGCSSPLPSLGNELNHAVQVVGYGVDHGHRYWLVRNSWGSWGEEGYMRISRENDDQTFVDDSPSSGTACNPYPKKQLVGGECGILFKPSYPSGVHSNLHELVV